MKKSPNDYHTDAIGAEIKNLAVSTYLHRFLQHFNQTAEHYGSCGYGKAVLGTHPMWEAVTRKVEPQHRQICTEH